MATKKAKAVEPKIEEPIKDEIESIKEESKVEEKVVEEVVEKVVEPIVEKPIVAEPLPVSKEELSMEERISAFVDSRMDSKIRLNDFLKSLFPLPKLGEPPLWINQAESKKLRVLLGEMQSKGLIKLSDSRYTLLGKSHYVGAEQVQKHYSIADLEIICQK